LWQCRIGRGVLIYSFHHSSEIQDSHDAIPACRE
jgi:hypothetical protein